jgi:hypothetical protein
MGKRVKATALSLRTERIIFLFLARGSIMLVQRIENKSEMRATPFISSMGQSLPGQASSSSGHARYAPKAEESSHMPLR